MSDPKDDGLRMPYPPAGKKKKKKAKKKKKWYFYFCFKLTIIIYIKVFLKFSYVVNFLYYFKNFLFLITNNRKAFFIFVKKSYLIHIFIVLFIFYFYKLLDLTFCLHYISNISI